MEKKKNIGLFIVIGMLVLLTVILLVLVGVLVWNGTKISGGEESDSQYSSELENVAGELETEKEALDSSNLLETGNKEIEYVLGGYKFTVPVKYDMLYSEATGPVVYMPDAFQMKIKIVDTSYEEVMKDPESMIQKSVDAGGIILQDVKEMKLDGKKYVYYRVDLSGEVCLVIYTQAPDKDKRLGAQIVLEQEDITDEEMLQAFSEIANSALETDEPDSTYDDIVVELAQKNGGVPSGEVKEESTLKLGEYEITHKVPDGFYLEYTSEDSDYSMEMYDTATPRVDVLCKFIDDEWFAGAQGYVEVSKYLNDSKVETMEVEGNTIYYVVEKYMDEDEQKQRIFAGCDMGDSRFYIVEAFVSDKDIDLSMETIYDFLIVSQ